MLNHNNAKVSLAIQGLIVTEAETKLLEDYLKGIVLAICAKVPLRKNSYHKFKLIEIGDCLLLD
ncbi:hypothetical protein KPL35_17930 [Clostridium sp. CF011]|uniref:hypothetical protein n=1 Tax=unclassified Clostridium TaxID=2614128 RepID=UPI001C0B9832|nr:MULTISPECIES: hypothetical protein [unclassified Clostridium]MBU3093911.1 hypothetical protein [Clostridium sp. CF011]MBW9147315.1 hypothetical protein [Clostridium sp. CM027]UVE42185.1 hypothetical protein KTC92_06995 [Clostridium sp. CM027]WAG71210.1 hypothetical protein LL036_07295 [Clostridium sp. CF011]